jgi:hypothetical protein
MRLACNSGPPRYAPRMQSWRTPTVNRKPAGAFWLSAAPFPHQPVVGIIFGLRD